MPQEDLKTQKPGKTEEATTTANVPSYYTTLIGTLDKGVSFLTLLGHFDFPSSVQKKAKEVTTSVLDLIDMIKGKDGEEFSDLGIFLDSLRDRYFESEVTTKDAAVIVEAAKVVVEGLTPGMEKAMSKTLKKKCESCGFQVPRYVGKYPNFCPECGEELNIEACKEVMKKRNESWKEVASIIAEIMYFSAEAKFEEGKFTSEKEDVEKYVESYGLSLREKGLTSIFEGRENLLTLALVKVLSDEEINESMVEKVERPSVDEFKKILEDLDSVAFSATYPLLLALNSVLVSKEDSLEKSITERMKKEGSYLYEALSGIKAWTVLKLEEDKAKGFRQFTEEMFSLPSEVFDSDEAKSTDQCESLAKSVIGEKTLEKIREEVDKRHKFKNAVLALESDESGFDINEVVKGFCSGITRLAIEHNLTSDSRIEIFIPIVVEKLNSVFEGKREEPINFLKGIFIRKSERSKED